jgi:anti-anti-sigma factor
MSAALVLVVSGEPEPTVVLSGELDLASVERLRRAVSQIGEPPRGVTIDLRGVSFLDVAGLRAVSEAVTGLVSIGHRVTVLPSASVTWLLAKLESAGCPMTIGERQPAPGPPQ